MTVIGLYDPASLTQKEGGLQISFVNAQDAGDVRTVVIRTAQQARRIAERLRAQADPVNCPFHALDRGMVKLKGVIRMMPDDDGVGLIWTPRKDGKYDTIAIRSTFDTSNANLPEKGLGFVVGYAEDDVIRFCQIAMRALPDDPRPAATATTPVSGTA